MNHSQRSIASWTRLHNVPQVLPKHQRNHSSPRVDPTPLPGGIFRLWKRGNRIVSGLMPPELFFPEQGWHLGGSTTMSGTQARRSAKTCTGLHHRRPLHREQHPSQKSRECHGQPRHLHWKYGRLHTIMSSTRAGRGKPAPL